MTEKEFLLPVLALIIWTLLIWVLMYAQRLPAMHRSGVNPEVAKLPDGDWKKELPLAARVSAHNYNHLMEQPTIFYALMFYIALSDQFSMPLYYCAWSYVVLRVLHSVVQVSAGKVILRFGLFVLSTFVLIGMVTMLLLPTPV